MNQYIYIFVFVAIFTYFITASPLKNEEWEQFCIIMKKKSPSHLSTIRVVFVMLSFFFLNLTYHLLRNENHHVK